MRVDAGLTQIEAAERLGKQQPNISALELTKRPNAETIGRFADACKRYPLHIGDGQWRIFTAEEVARILREFPAW